MSDSTLSDLFTSDLTRMDLVDIRKRVKEEDQEFTASFEWLRIKLKRAVFSKETLYFLRQLSAYINLDGGKDALSGIEQDLIIGLVKQQIAEERITEEKQAEEKQAEAVLGEDEEEVTSNGKPRQANSEPYLTEAIPVELELFGSQELEGIKAISAYLSVLYRALPAVSAFRERYLPAALLSATEADAFLRSAALRFLCASDFERFEVDLLDHRAEVMSLARAKLTTEQKERLVGDIIVYPATQRPFSAEEGAGRWYQYTVVIALTASGSTRSKPTKHVTEEKQVIEKTLVVRENKPIFTFSDPFFKPDHSIVIEDDNFPHWFPGSMADDLHQIITSRAASGSIPGGALMKALFVLTGTVSYNPVTIRAVKPIAADLSSLEAGTLIARRLQAGEGFCGRIKIEADAWVTADTIKKIYQQQQGILQQQSILAQASGAKTRHKLSGADSLQLVIEVLGIYLSEKIAPSYQHAYTTLRQAGKITGTADNFRKKYKRACQILSIPVNIDAVVQSLRKLP